MAPNLANDPDTLAHPPAAILDAVARTDLRDLPRRLGVPGSLVPDVVQDVVITAFLALHRKGRALLLPGAHEPRWSRVRPFVVRIFRDCARDALKRAWQRRELPMGLAADLPLSEVAAPGDLTPLTPEERAANAERRAVLRGILARLPEGHAEVLVLHAVEGLTDQEIATQLRIRENTVRSRLARARTRARAAVRNLPEDERRLLRGSPLLALLLWSSSAEASSRGRPRAPAVAVLLVVLVTGLGIADVPAGVVHRAPSPVPGFAVAEHVAGNSVADTAGGPQAAMVVRAEPVAVRAEPAASSVARAVVPARSPRLMVAGTEDTLPAEKVLISAARGAMATEAYPLALAKLAAHEARYPSGKLAGTRDLLKADVREQMARRSPSTPSTLHEGGR